MTPRDPYHAEFVEYAKDNEFDWANGLDRIWKNKVCHRCDGEGTTWHGLSFTAQDFAEDPDLGDSIRAGAFDRPCEECHGNKVIQSLDVQTLHHEVQQEYLRWENEAISLALVEQGERMRGA